MWWLRTRRRAQAWHELHVRAFADYDSGKIDVERWWSDRVAGQYGLISHGAASVPYALEMLDSPNAGIREDGAAVLAEVGRNARAVDALLSRLERETADQPRDAIIQALGRMKDKRAIPHLA